MTELVTLQPMAVSNSDIAERMLEDQKKLAGRGDKRRISIRGGRFRLMVGGEQVGNAKSTPLNVIIVRNSEIGRTYYDVVYDPDDPKPPVCWSADGIAPAPDVDKDNRMSPTCAACKMNIKGSGTGTSRACRFSVRLAILLEGDPDRNIYQMQIPATSFFGKRSGTDMGMQAYGTYLTEQKNVFSSVVTELRFDEDSETPKLFFRPMRNVTQEELDAAEGLYDAEVTEEAVTMSVFQTDRDGDAGDAAPEPEKVKEPEPEPEPEPKPVKEDVVEEPVTRAAKADTPKPSSGADDPLLAKIAGW